MIRPMIRPLIRSMIRSPVRESITQRILIDLKSVTQEHYTLQNPVVEAGVFNHSYECVIPIAGGYIVADNTPSTGASRIAIQSDGALFISTDGAAPYPGVIFPELAAAVGDTLFHEIGMRRDASNVITISLDEVDIDSRVGAGTFTFNSIGDKKGGVTAIPSWDGIIASPDLGNGNDWKLDQDPGNTEQSSGGSNIATYVNIPTGLPSRELFTLNQAGTQWDGNNGTTLVIA